MDIKNPNGYIKNESNIIEFPLDTIAIDKLDDIVIEYLVADGTILIEDIPLKSLRQSSAYANTQMNDHSPIGDITKWFHIIAGCKIEFYDKLGISIDGYKIRFKHGEDSEI